MFLSSEYVPSFWKNDWYLDCQNKLEINTSSRNVDVVEYAVLLSVWNSLPI